MPKPKSTMARVDFLFGGILVWSLVSTTLLIHQFHDNTRLQEQLAASQRATTKVKKYIVNPKAFEQEKKKKKKNGKKKTTKATNGAPKKKNEKKGPNGTQKEKKKKKAESRPVAAAEPAAEPVAKKRGYRGQEFKIVQDATKLSNYTGTTDLLSANEFPFTRSLRDFRASSDFYIYVVESTTDNGEGGSPLQWHEVQWKSLLENWNRNSTFDDIITLSTSLQNENAERAENVMPKKFVIHCLPKTASTTLRKACRRHLWTNCEALELPMKQDPFGFRQIDDFFTAVRYCPEIDHFCVQGGDDMMTIINHEEKAESEQEGEGESYPLHFIHMVPFRNFDSWVESAVKQVFVIDGSCDRVGQLLDHNCLGYREMYMELYPKIALALLTGMGFNANDKGLTGEGKSQHHIVLYNYQDTDVIIAETSRYFGIEPLARTDEQAKANRGEGTCPARISDKFHECHDETLMTQDSIRMLRPERKRRTQEMREMKHALQCLRSGRQIGCQHDEEEDGDSGGDGVSEAVVVENVVS